ncbi:MAG TPA: acyltransferase [Vitreimonas sp.]|jgi:peptidoglycan/LPS O-acetylase OafA/YrhL|nr:acyltransferase [Vitreimonas sp.]
MTEAAADKPRDIGLDAARGALMAYIVIVIHGTFWLSVIPPGPGSWLLFEMPPVFIITGAAFFLGELAKGRRTPYPKFLWRRAVRIMLPYFAYALACAAIVLVVRYQQDGASAQTIWAAVWAWINPITRGGGHTMYMLSWHLWFVPPFLLVTALMPFIAPRGAPLWLRPWLLALIGFAIVLGAHQINFPQNEIVQNAIFYALWAIFGVLIASAPGRYKTWEYALVLLLSLAGIFAANLAFPGRVTLDMQHNKFPPDAMFFLFCCAWMMLLLIVVRLLGDVRVDKLAHLPVLKPFMSAGYSIYLWQGLGYTIAAAVGRPQHWSPYVIWPLAIAITIILGLIASPLERIRVR